MSKTNRKWRFEDLGPFARRIVRRHELWWEPPLRWWSPLGWTEALHRRRERSIVRAESDPPEAWRCCARWPRTLVNKRLGRIFAGAHGVRLPELYWHGRHADAPLETLPPRFVIRHERGARRRGVYVVRDGRDLLRGEPASADDLRERLARDEAGGRPNPILIEELIEREGGLGRLPLEFKCHVFAGAVAAVQMFERRAAVDSRHRYYTTDWRSFDPPCDVGKEPLDETSAPIYLAEILQAASRLGRAIGTYMRIDFFGSDRGLYFNEFSSAPNLGSLNHTAACDAIFEAAWRAHCPGAE